MKIKSYLIAGLLVIATQARADIEIEIVNNTAYGTGTKVPGQPSLSVLPLEIGGHYSYASNRHTSSRLSNKAKIKANGTTKETWTWPENFQKGDYLKLEVNFSAKKEPNIYYGMGSGRSGEFQWNGNPIIITIDSTKDWHTNPITITNP